LFTFTWRAASAPTKLPTLLRSTIEFGANTVAKAVVPLPHSTLVPFP